MPQNTINTILTAEHDKTSSVRVKKAGIYKWNGSQWERWEGFIDIDSYDYFEQVTGNITQADSTISFAQEVKTADILNTGSNEVFINFGAAATITDYRLQPGESYSVPLKFTDLHAICSAGEASTIKMIGYY